MSFCIGGTDFATPACTTAGIADVIFQPGLSPDNNKSQWHPPTSSATSKPASGPPPTPSGPTPASGPVLGLIFLRYAERRFHEVESGLLRKGMAAGDVEPYDYKAEGAC